MTVETRFVVIRNGLEVDTFVDRKEADNYDKMLDVGDFIADLLEKSPVELTEQQREELGIYLAQHREALLAVLQPKKLKPKTDESA